LIVTTLKARLTIRTQILIISLLIPCLSSAASYCVSSQARLYEVLNTAALSAADDDIRVAAGVFNMPAQINLEIQGALTISGGWSSLFFDMCGKQALGAKTTLLGNIDYGVYLRPRSALNLDRIDFVRWSNIAIRDSFPEPVPAILPEIRISRCGFSAMRSWGLNLAITRHHTRIENSVFTGNGANALRFFSVPETAIQHLVQFNTIADNAGGIFVNTNANAQLRVLNTVSTNNAYGDLEVYGTVPQVKNSFWNVGMLTLSPDCTGNLSGTAGLNSQLRPLAGSQLIDAGAFAQQVRPKFDYAGSPRLLALRPDIGAYEGAAAQ